MPEVSSTTSVAARVRAIQQRNASRPRDGSDDAETIAKRIIARRGEPTLADKLAEASRAANITGEGGG